MGCSPSIEGSDNGGALELRAEGWAPSNNEHRVFICRFCGGPKCKREDYKKQKVGPQAIKGLHSTYITSHVLGMQRPSDKKIKQHDVLGQMKAQHVCAVLNLQSHGEHPLCGDGIDAESGYSYKPETFMDAGIYYYNFGFVDMGVPSMETMMRIVQVISFHVDRDQKVAVHCHAGYGRTGIAIACWLCYSSWVSPEKAIHMLRTRRPGCVQTSRQVKFITQFAAFLVQARKVFPEHGEHALGLAAMISRQRVYLHGEERDGLTHVPKLVQRVAQAVMLQGHAAAALAGVVDLDQGTETWVKQSEASVRQLRQRINGDDYTALSGCQTRHLMQLLLDFLDMLREPLLPEGLAQPAPVDVHQVAGKLLQSPVCARATLAAVVELLAFCAEGAGEDDRQCLYLRFAYALFHPAHVRLASATANILPFRTLVARPYDHSVGVNSEHRFSHLARVTPGEVGHSQHFDTLQDLASTLRQITEKWAVIVEGMDANRTDVVGILAEQKTGDDPLEPRAAEAEQKEEEKKQEEGRPEETVRQEDEGHVEENEACI
jgi:hypothetical protein